jgi:hypothetical protein
MFGKIRHKSELSVPIVNYIGTRIQKGAQFKSKLQHTGIRPQHDRPVTCVIAQQYCSATWSRFTLIPGRKNPERV